MPFLATVGGYTGSALIYLYFKWLILNDYLAFTGVTPQKSKSGTAPWRENIKRWAGDDGAA